MKLIIFGTGKYYQEFKRYINPEQVICFIDNDPSKQHSWLDGKEIKAVKDVDFLECDYVLVMVMRYQNIFEQLLRLGVPQEKIKLYFELGEMIHLHPSVNYGGRTISLKNWVQDDVHEHHVLLVAHELTRNGVAVVLMHTAEILIELGYSVIVTGLIGGALEADLRDRNIGFITGMGAFYRGVEIKEYMHAVDFVISGSVGTADFVEYMSDTDIPIIWWMHESNDQNFIDFNISQRRNIHYYAGGSRVVDMFKKYYPNRKIQKLLYFLPDKEKSQVRVKNKKLRVSVIGAVNYRKAQDIYVNAISLLPEESKISAEFDIVGSIVEPVIDVEGLSMRPEINYIGELSESSLEEYIDSVDILVSCSRDDPMPVVVSQAMQNEILCIVSDQVGQSEYIEDGKNGFIFHSENSQQLSDILKFCIDNPEIVERMGKASYKIYESFFSEKEMKRNLKKIIMEITMGE